MQLKCVDKNLSLISCMVQRILIAVYHFPISEVSDDVEFTDISSTSLEDLEKITDDCVQEAADEEEDQVDVLPSSSTNEVTERKQPKLVTNKICLVCGDAALGKNFGAVSCESCKAFFRRNALKVRILS